MNLSLEGFKYDMSTFHNGTSEYSVRLHLMQIDNQLPGTMYAVVLGAAPVKHTVARAPDTPVPDGALQLLHVVTICVPLACCRDCVVIWMEQGWC